MSGRVRHARAPSEQFGKKALSHLQVIDEIAVIARSARDPVELF
jgi:hypothetical protein